MDDRGKDGLDAKINTTEELPVFFDAQVQTLFSRYVDNLDEALAVLDENNRDVVGQTRAFEENVESFSE